MTFKWYHYLICAILIIIGIFCAIELFNIFNVKSAEYGKAITFETENNYDEVSVFDFGVIDFDVDNSNTYYSTSTFAPIEFDGTNKDYVVIFNGQPLSNVVIAPGKINGNLCINFYDLDGEIITTANLSVLIEYTASLTRVTTSIKNTNNAVSYFNAYMQINGAVLKVLI